MEKQQPAYYTIIPESLWNEADAIVEYLTTYPFLQPTYCKHCGDRNITLSKSEPPNLNNLNTYRCRTCGRRFNQVTGTIFMRMQHLSIWGKFAILRLSGKSTNEISRTIGLPATTCNKRANQLEQIMAEHWPSLYQWWKPHQDYIDHQLSPSVEKEYKYFMHWLEKIMEQPQATCPHCGRYPINRIKNTHRPLFHCWQCKKTFSLLKDSPLKKIFQLEYLIPYTKVLVKGESTKSIAKRFQVEEETVANWRRKFIEQMQLLNLGELIHWITWQHSRECAYKSKLTRQEL